MFFPKNLRPGAGLDRAAQSVFIYGLYLVVLGGVLILRPNGLLCLFRFQATQEIWIRVVGLLVVCLGSYYLLATRREFPGFFQWTVVERTFTFLCFLVFVLTRLAPPPLALFGLADLLGGLWTAVALRRSSAVQPGLKG